MKEELKVISYAKKGVDSAIAGFGLTQEKADQIAENIQKAFDNQKAKDKKVFDIVNVIAQFSETCENANELAFGCYNIGIYIERFNLSTRLSAILK